MADTVPGDKTTTAVVTVGSTTNGTLETNTDHDWYKISLTAGQAITVTINGVTLEDPYLYIYNSQGNLLYENDDISAGVIRDSKVSFSAPSSGVYYIDVESYGEQYSGTYQVVVSTYTPPPMATVDQLADQLVNGYWSGDDHHFDVSQGGTIDVNLNGLTAAGQALARAALDLWSDVIGVSFHEVTSGGQIIFNDDQNGAFTDSNWAGGIIEYSNVNIGTDWLASYGTGLNTYSFQSYVHEIGHALGLGHEGNYNDVATYPYDSSFQNDAWSTSIMSYFSQQDNTYFAGQGFSEDFAVTPMMADIVAMQTLYGLSTITRTGDTTYGFNSNAGRSVYDATQFNDVAYTIFDSGGNDTLDYSGFSASQTINLNPETFSNVGNNTGNVSIARGTVIENAIGGSGADTLTGNSVDNWLRGNGGNDTLNGGNGNDRLSGGSGTNALNGGSGSDTADYTSGVTAAVTASLATASATYNSGAAHDNFNSIENLRGSTFDDKLTGDANANALEGGAGDDYLYGNAGSDALTGGAGYDRMYGGTGDDTYYANDSTDFAYENLGEGHDQVIATVDHQLRDNVEDLTLTGAAYIGKGNAGDNSITGTNNANKLYGYEGNDTLNGLGGDDYLFGADGSDTLTGGAGYDRMYGGIGDDFYYVNDTSDYAYEYLGEGYDTVTSSINHTLRANIEELRLAGSADLRGFGNALNNVMVGNSGANQLSGADGNDTLKGAGGADILYGQNGNDTLDGGAGMDRFYGGAGADKFVFRDGDFAGKTSSTADRIHDFSEAEGDMVHLSNVDANTLLGGDQAFTFIGTAGFGHHAGELRTYQSAGQTYLAGDTNGDGSADFLIRIDGLHTLTSADLVL